MALFKTSSSGVLKIRFSYFNGSYIEEVHFMQLLPGQKIEVEVIEGEELVDELEWGEANE